MSKYWEWGTFLTGAAIGLIFGVIALATSLDEKVVLK